jgi:hypothetical protein
MTNQDISADKRLQHKIKGRLAMTSLHLKAQEGARTEPVIMATEGPELPSLYQG